MESFKAQEGFFPNKAVRTWLTTYSSYDAVPALSRKDPGPGPTTGLGPWMQIPTTNGQHYRIEGTLDGSGTVEVFNWNDNSGSPADLIGDGTIAACNLVH
jgi:hypothetical protein